MSYLGAKGLLLSPLFLSILCRANRVVLALQLKPLRGFIAFAQEDTLHVSSSYPPYGGIHHPFGMVFSLRENERPPCKDPCGPLAGGASIAYCYYEAYAMVDTYPQ